MAELVVNIVMSKLGDMIVQEAQRLGEVGEQVKWPQRELTNLQCYLRDADSKRRKGDSRVENWLNQLREVAYRIEDATDTFYQEVEDNRQRDPGFLHKMKELCRKPFEVPVLRKLATEFGEIKKDLEGITKSRIDYGIEPLQEKKEAIILRYRKTANRDVDETEVVGLVTGKNNILKLLRPEETTRRAVITIVGTGGLGKTTLARMVYKSAKADFSFCIMLSVSQQFSLTELLKEMISKHKFNVPSNKDVDYYVGELNSILNSRRYLIILDDVWKVDLWYNLKDALPDVKNGSRVLITSRSIDVAKSADPKMTPYELNFLSKKESIDLLLKTALPYQEPDEKCPSVLLELAEELSQKCKGLPLALIVLGGILSTKDQTYNGWERVLRTMDWHSDGKDCMDVLSMSYEDMPYYLKACFLYLASFPEDYEICAKRLIRMWVAEGFIPQEDKKTMEETAENCMEQLFQRSMLQVSSRSYNGSIKYCRVHDLLRDLAMHEAAKQNFVTVLQKPQDVSQSNRVTRRASVQSYRPLQFMEYLGSNTRSLLWFVGSDSLPTVSNFRLLKVVEIVGVKMPYYTYFKGLEKLIHLKYFGLRYCNNLLLPSSSLSSLKNLETFYFGGHSIKRPIRYRNQNWRPTGLWTISTLRHVTYDEGIIVGLPTSTNLRNLQTLRWVLVMKTWSTNRFPRFGNLLKLGLEFCSSFEGLENWDGALHMLGALPSLISLGIRTKREDIPVEIVYPSVLPKYHKLQSLRLEGKWSNGVTLDSSLLPSHLVKLTLRGSRLNQDPMPELGKLNSLRKLRIGEYAYEGTQMTCLAGFPVLESLELDLFDLKVKALTVAEGVMPKLKHLRCSDEVQLEMPPELKHLAYN